MDNRKSWLEWRSEGLGASDAPIVMGVSPWTTPHQLWEYKTGRGEKAQSNWATRKGNEMEPRARAHFELTVNLDFPPVLIEHPKFPFMRASLDGWNAEHKIVLEIKCPGKDDHEKAAKGEVPEKYYPQLQHQLFVTGAAKVFYYSYTEDENKNGSGHTVEVFANPEYQKVLFENMCKFWKCVQDDVEPELSDKDYKTVRNRDLHAVLNTWHETKKNIEILEKRLETLKTEILEHSDVKGKRVKCGSFHIGIVNRKGSIQYGKIPELSTVDLDQYRSKGSVYQTISYKEPKQED